MDRAFTCYDGGDWANWLLQVELICSSSRALGIEYTPYEANLGFSPEETPYLLFPIRASIHISSTAFERLRHLRDVHELVSFVLRLPKDEMQTYSKPSAAPQFQPGNSASVVAKGLFLRGQLNHKHTDMQFGPFTVQENVGARKQLHIGRPIYCTHASNVSR
jgi:hypothetical protein